MTVVHLVEHTAFDFDALFESLKGHEYQQLVVLATNGNGSFEWFGNVTLGEAFLLMAKAQAELLKED